MDIIGWIDWTNIWNRVIAGILLFGITGGTTWFIRITRSHRQNHSQQQPIQTKQISPDEDPVITKIPEKEPEIPPNLILQDILEDAQIERERELARKRKAIITDPTLSPEQKIKLLKVTGLTDGEIENLLRHRLGL